LNRGKERDGIVTEDFREHRTLGSTGLRVSRLGLASGYGIDSSGVEKAYHDYGINYYYWGSRRGDGMKTALRRLVKAGRERLVIALQTYDHLGFFMRRTVEKGLLALGIDYCDVLILGWFNRPPGGRVLDAALGLRESGKVRHLAMSGHNRSLFGTLARRADSPLDLFMVRYNAAHRGAEEDIFPHLPPGDRPGVTVYTATCWGKLLRERKMPPGERPLTAAECYRFVLSNPAVDLCMTGPKNLAEMEEGMRALAEGPLTEAEMRRVRRVGDYVRK